MSQNETTLGPKVTTTTTTTTGAESHQYQPQNVSSYIGVSNSTPSNPPYQKSYYALTKDSHATAPPQYDDKCNAIQKAVIGQPEASPEGYFQPK